MASIKQLDERRYKITVSNGYRPNGKKISKAKTIQVPSGVPKRGIGQYVAHAAEELERSFKTGYAEDGEMTFEEFASRWLNRQTKYAPSTIAAYQRMLEVVYPMIGGIRLTSSDRWRWKICSPRCASASTTEGSSTNQPRSGTSP